MTSSHTHPTSKKTLVVGDTHAKPEIIYQIINSSTKFDTYIFLGDYHDDWKASPNDSYQVISQLLDFKHKSPSKVILLYGNHDLSNWLPEYFKCSGFNYLTSALTEPLFSLNDFQLSYAIGNTLFTHAGLTQSWYQEFVKPFIKPRMNQCLANLISVYLNSKFNSQDPDFITALRYVGKARGGIGNPSPLWADETELITDTAQGINQIVGHTPTESIINYDINSNNLKFCDTFSTSFNFYTGEETPIGDQTCLILNTFMKKITSTQIIHLNQL